MSVDDQKLITLPVHGDTRGSLVAIESGHHADFNIERVYYIYGTEPGVARGFHAHRKLRQLAICVTGRCVMLLDDGRSKRTVTLDRPELAVEIGPMIWHEMSELTADTVLMVLADQRYDESDYIRHYNDFIAEMKAA